MPLDYGELRRMARRYMRWQPSGHTLQATALIHEAYLRLVAQDPDRVRSLQLIERSGGCGQGHG